jgi:hypothetical protein
VADSVVLLRQAHDQFCGTRPRFAHFYLPAEQGRAIRLAGAEITDPVVIAAKVAPAIAETVKKQVEAGIDCVGDGEFWTARRKAALPAASLAR